jgi:hypothetical protein
MDLVFNLAAVNTELLDLQLQAVGADYGGVSTGPSDDPANPVAVRVHLDDAATQAEQDHATAIVRSHDPTKLTTAQQAAATVQSQFNAISSKLSQIQTQQAALAAQLASFNVATDPAAIAAALNTLVPQIGASIGAVSQILSAIVPLVQQQGR